MGSGPLCASAWLFWRGCAPIQSSANLTLAPHSGHGSTKTPLPKHRNLVHAQRTHFTVLPPAIFQSSSSFQRTGAGSAFGPTFFSRAASRRSASAREQDLSAMSRSISRSSSGKRNRNCGVMLGLRSPAFSSLLCRPGTSRSLSRFLVGGLSPVRTRRRAWCISLSAIPAPARPGGPVQWCAASFTFPPLSEFPRFAACWSAYLPGYKVPGKVGN